ncbi:MAG: hypothetical protein ACM35H_15290 [Bacteroidota bacterium]|nr:hypothetical protein [Kiloniellaceae bacterium]
MPSTSSFPAAAREHDGAPRSVAQLAFPEILVIWALRRYSNCRLSAEARAAVIAPEFSRAFGLARLKETLAAFSRLAVSLAASARLPQALSVLEDDRINATEEALLASLAALQRGAAAQARALGEWILLPAGRAAFLAAAERLAQVMREVGHLLPYQPPRRRGLLAEQAEGALLPTAACAEDLRPGERAVVAATRVWVAAFRGQEDALAAVRAEFTRRLNGEAALWGDRRSGDDAGLSLHAILRNTTLAATRSVDVRCPACPGLSPDEARLLEAVAWLQHDVAPPAETALGDWLPPAAVRLSLGAARGLALALLAAELPLPRRSWDFEALAETAHPPHGMQDDASPQPARSGRAPTVH